MKRILIAAVALASLAAPMAASAQSNGEMRDHRELQQDKRDLQHSRDKAKRDGRVTPNERRDLNQDRRDVNQDRRDVRQDRGAVRTDRWDRNNRSWWRGRAEFRGYNGRRAGYWYTPGYGYRQIDRRWAGYNWRRGGYVPVGYRNFYVRNPYFYGLRAAPYGHRWVYVDNNLVLIAIATGLIADVVYNAY